MSSTNSLWWPPDRVQAALTPEYIVGQLPPNCLPRLVTPLPWGEGLTSESYLDWIVTKAGRLFLILADIGIPERIFALVDASVDDVDLPFAAHSIDRLHLSPDGDDPALDAKFFHAQWRFTVRGIEEGEYVKFTANEGVPIEVQRTDSTLAKEGVEKVVLAGAVCRVYLRTQVTIGAAPHFFEEDEVLEEIRSLRRLAHDHVFSTYASYYSAIDKTVCILFNGHYERTLLSFLADPPPTFKRLEKAHRRHILVNWPHCLANGLAWLHAHGHPHRGIRPSNILIDADFRIFLGQFEELDTLLPPLKVDDVEAYQYGAPERWQRSAAVQDTQPHQPLLLPSGGRTARRPSMKSAKLNLPKIRGPSNPDNATARSDSVGSQDTAIRITSPRARFSFALSTTSSASSASSDGSNNNTNSRKRILPSIRQRPIFYTPSIASSSSSSGASARPLSTITTTTTTDQSLNNTNNNHTIVQTWNAATATATASDIFSLAAITLDILTVLCKRKLSSFTHHRGAKNRTAGRGGGVADSSFHLDRNADQVFSWISLLEKDAEKKRKSDFAVFGVGVLGMLKVSREMLSRDPAGRSSAREVEGMFGELIRRAGIEVHCQPSALERFSRAPKREEKLDAYAAPRSSSADTSDRDSPSPSDSMIEFDTTGYPDYQDDYIHSSDSE